MPDDTPKAEPDATAPEVAVEPPPSKMGRKRNVATKMIQMAELEAALIEGRPISQTVLQYAEACEITGRQAWEDYKRIQEKWALQAAEVRNNPNLGLGQAILRRNQLFRAAVTNNNLELALEVEKDRGKLLDLYMFDHAQRKDAVTGGRAATDMGKYVSDPAGYFRDVLKIELTPDQEALTKAALLPPYRVKARAGHSVGKTCWAAGMVNWFFDTHDPGVVISTAPTFRDVKDVLWAEVRIQRKRAGLPDAFGGANAPSMATSENHWAKGFTARKGESFQGRHHKYMLFVFDEDEGIEETYFRTTDTMFDPGGNHIWISIGNPTTTTSQSYREEQSVGADKSPKWKLFTLSCLNHPNVKAALEGKPLPVPGAVTLEQISQWVQDWCSPIEARDATTTDVEWLPGSGKWFRPGPIFQSRVLGIRPTISSDSIWSEQVWTLAETNALPLDPRWQPEIGVDVARFGDDWTVIHGRQGPSSIYHEQGNGWDTTVTAGRVIEAAKALAAAYNKTRGDCPYLKADDVLIKVDDDGVGGGVTDLLRANGMSVLAINAGSVAVRSKDYPRRRDELWIEVSDNAKRKYLDLSRLTPEVLARLKQQALACKYTLDYAGRRLVEPKHEVKKRIGRSPDDMDALNLAYAGGGVDYPEMIVN